MVFRLAHVTDPHFHPEGGVALGELRGKRWAGALNYWLRRRFKHRMELLAALADDLRASPPDHLAVTGDLSNLALEAEWRAARTWLEGVAPQPEGATLIPGNHDAYIPEVVDAGAFESHFGAWQRPDVAQGDAAYPFVRLRGPLALVGVNSCVATGDLGAWGLLGDAQLARLEALLARPEVRARRRVVLVHHPPVRHKGGEHRNLKDRARFAEVLTRVGAELVLHGHDHRDQRAELAGPDGARIPVLGGGSASYAGAPAGRARYNVLEFGDGRDVTLVTRAHDAAAGRFTEVRREALA